MIFLRASYLSTHVGTVTPLLNFFNDQNTFRHSERVCMHACSNACVELSNDSRARVQPFDHASQNASIGFAKASGRSSGKNSRPSSTSTTCFAPGMVSLSQYAHFLSKKISFSPQTISVGTCNAFSA